MNLPYDFDYYLKRGIVRKKQPNFSRAEFLLKEAGKSLIGLNERINKIGINEFNSNSIIKDAHDILIQSVRAEMLLDGLEASGNFAHEAEIAYMKKLNISNADIIQANEIRQARNGINYYGKIFDVEYAKKTVRLMKNILKGLSGLRR